MRKKWKMSLIVAVIMVFSLVLVTGCSAGGAEQTPSQSVQKSEAATESASAAASSGSTESAASSGSVDYSKYKIGSTANNVGTDAYQTMHDKTLRAYAAELKVNLIQLDALGDVTTQINQVKDLIQQKCNVIIIWPVNGEALVPAAKEAYEAGIPVVIANSPIDESGYDYTKCFVGPNNVLEANYAAEMMNDLFPNGAKIVEITGLPGYTTATERHDGFVEKINSNIETMDSQPGDWNREKAQAQMENFLLKYDAIDAVYCADDNMAIGAINAIEAAGREDEIKVVSCCFFGDDEAKAYIKDGRIAGSVLQSPMTDAKTTLDVALKVAAGEEVPFYNYIDTPKVMVDNIDSLNLPAWE